ncbi:hypothetical protein HCN44_004237 [Aphidius gifuensis]|uniref:Uncharacterized protein n=1 Tax=Aphidius gifuensis TaxID=684658 RepID=A0A834XZ96_APHGI|nr:rhythmically expressed gene 5 protein [Aphidius gifuensis]KAF7994765.1 hypothetical protein HCN44_004237 [Aphidius gifuensis]
MKKELRSILMMTIMVSILSIIYVDGSAIPMWEFLSRDEKISHLYRIFSKQVTTFCHDSSKPDCNKNLIISGLQQLANIDENMLDQLDPYQRDANEMIWRALVGNDKFANRVSHDSDSYYTTDADPLATSGSDYNGLGEESAPGNDYIRPSSNDGPYLVGPMVIRVYPDGRPVPEDHQHSLPKDEDLDDLKFPRIPSIKEIQSSKDRITSTFLFKKNYDLPKKNVLKKNNDQWLFTTRPQIINYQQTNGYIRDRRFIIPFHYFK